MMRAHGAADEVDKHDFDDGSQPRGCRADRQAHYSPLADRRVDDPVGTEFLGESFGGAKGSAERDVLAEDVDGRIAAQFFGETGANGFKVSLLRHDLLFIIVSS